MDVFDLDEKLLGDYSRFARSFTQIRAADIRDGVDQIYATKHFWPDPLISINPHFEHGSSVEELVAKQLLHPNTAKIFRIDGESIRLHRHQEQATIKAQRRTSFAVTTGTGSGKSLCFFIPIIDAAASRRSTSSGGGWHRICAWQAGLVFAGQVSDLPGLWRPAIAASQRDQQTRGTVC